MTELVITAVWLFTLGAVVYFGVTEIVKLVSIEDVPTRRMRGGRMTMPGTDVV
jgi:hypothetical protein